MLLHYVVAVVLAAVLVVIEGVSSFSKTFGIPDASIALVLMGLHVFSPDYTFCKLFNDGFIGLCVWWGRGGVDFQL